MNGIGINTHIPTKDDIDKVISCGFDWIRIDFNWNTIEPKRGSFKWDSLDTAISYAKSKGLKIYGTIAYVPFWLNADHRSCPDVFNWVYFCTKVAQRYNGKVDIIGLWNEPNLKQFYIGSKEDYVKIILEAGHNAIKSVNPNIQVAAGDLATTGNSDWYDWFKLLKKHTDLFDCFMWHTYQENASTVISRYSIGKFPPLGWLINKWKPFSWEIDEFRKKGKRIFLTETGLKARINKNKELKAQRDFVKDLDKIRKETKAEAVFLYDLLDHPQFKDKWGIYDDIGSPKLAAQWLMDNKQ